MTKAHWKQSWGALRELGYWKTRQFYGCEAADITSVCFLKREEGPNAEFPFAALDWRLESFRAKRHNAQPLQG